MRTAKLCDLFVTPATELLVLDSADDCEAGFFFTMEGM